MQHNPLSELNPATAHLWDIGDRWTEELLERHSWLLNAAEQIRSDDMSDRLPGTTYDNPIWYRGYRIHIGPRYTRDSQWQFAHDEFDGAPMHTGDGPADRRYGMAETIGDCKAEIDEIEESTKEGGSAQEAAR